MQHLRKTHDEEGAAAVEFALVFPLLIMILFGIIEFGRVYSEYQVYQGAAREGARFAAVRNASGTGPDIDAVRARVIDAAAPYGGNVTSGSISVAPQCSASNVGGVVKVTWSQPVSITIPLLPDWTGNLPIKSAFRCE